MKILKLIIILFFTFSVCTGQLYNGLGIKAGISSSNQDWDYTVNFADFTGSYIYGFYFGIFAEGLNYNIFSSIFEISYVRKGFNSKIMGTKLANNEQGYIETGYLVNKIDYISLSYFAKFRYENKYIVPYVLLGPRIDFQIDENIEIKPSSNQFKKTTWGYSFGLGLIYNKIEDIDLLIEFVSSPDVSNLYSSEHLEISKYSYEFKFGVFLKNLWF